LRYLTAIALIFLMYLNGYILNDGLTPRIRARAHAYTNSAEDFFCVSEVAGRIVACGGFYVLKEAYTVNMAWGMVLKDFQQQGYGRQLFQHRLKQAQQLRQDIKIVLDTSQHTCGFFEKMGMKTTEITKDGYGTGLDRYDME
jgi:N-acetylglutamate synthase-like GNAT family acetyltransferase